MLTSKMYRTVEQVYCDECSLQFILENHGTPLNRVETGTPCTCDKCGLRFKSK